MDASAPKTQAPVANIELKAKLLLLALLIMVCGSVAYVMYARGAFESTQELVLRADDSEGVAVGMELKFSGFAIGRVRRIGLNKDGKVHIVVDLLRREVRWLRANSVFTLERGLLGDTHLRAFTGDMSAGPLPHGAVRDVLGGDVAADIPRLVSTVNELANHLERLTRNDSSLAVSLANVQTLTGRMNDKNGALGVVLGSEANARKVVAALDGVNTLLARGDAVLGSGNTLLQNADSRLFGKAGKGGVAGSAQATVEELRALFSDARTSLKKVDGVLAEAQAVGANARVATTDLGLLRAQVEDSLRKVEHLVNEVNRKWPLARDTELKLP